MSELHLATSAHSGPNRSEIVSTGQNFTISAHCNESSQNRWIFAILSNTGGSKYFTRKCGGFLELTPHDGMDSLELCLTTRCCRSRSDKDKADGFSLVILHA
jgi:hypothetical protein